jgi:hypothetical protein
MWLGATLAPTAESEPQPCRTRLECPNLLPGFFILKASPNYTTNIVVSWRVGGVFCRNKERRCNEEARPRTARTSFMKRLSQRRRPRGGRPPAGFRPGERVRDYPQLSVRIPRETKVAVAALSVMQVQPQWRIVLESIECYIRSLSKSDQRRLKERIKRPR